MKSNKKYKSFILFFSAILFFAFTQHVCSIENEPVENKKNIDETTERRVIVYYFHGNVRCYTCKRIEQLTSEAVTEAFVNEIKTGFVEMKVINVDEKGNSHFSKDYQLFTQSVVVSDIEKGKEKQWKNLQKVWELVRDEKAFKEYIKKEIEEYLS